VREAPEVRRSSDEVVQAEVEKADAEGVRTRIVGEFRGWTGTRIPPRNGRSGGSGFPVDVLSR